MIFKKYEQHIITNSIAEVVSYEHWIIAVAMVVFALLLIFYDRKI